MMTRAGAPWPRPSELPDPVEAFRARAARDRAAIRQRLPMVAAAAPWRRLAPTLAELEALAHGLAGAGGTFGFPALSAAAARVERRIEGWRRAAPPTLTARQIAGLRRLVGLVLDELSVAAVAAPPQAPRPPR